jgi:hypothetical protein
MDISLTGLVKLFDCKLGHLKQADPEFTVKVFQNILFQIHDYTPTPPPPPPPQLPPTFITLPPLQKEKVRHPKSTKAERKKARETQENERKIALQLQIFRAWEEGNQKPSPPTYSQCQA